MIVYMIVALLNGILIALARIINSHLGLSVGIFKASFWNHLVGFVLLLIILLFSTNSIPDINTDIPYIVYVGGVIGVLFVAINNYVLPKIGITKTVILVVSGQMISAVIIDLKDKSITAILLQILGILLLVLGVYLSKVKTIKAKNDC